MKMAATMNRPAIMERRSMTAKALTSGGLLLLAIGVGVMAVPYFTGWLRGTDAGESVDSAVIPQLQPAVINGDRAYGYLKSIVAIGPRPAGTAANTKQRNMVAAHFKAMGATIKEQPFTSRDPISGKRIEMVNLIGSWYPDRTDRVVLGAHYDTRPFPDQEPDPELRRTPFLGANDGASGVALLMEIAHHLNDSQTPWGVDLVLFDGEELVYDRQGEYFLGSKAFAKAYKTQRKAGKAGSRYVAGFVLDMVGGKNLDLKREPFSAKLAPKLVDDVWELAAKLKVRAFRDDFGREVLDDHLPLNDAGIPTIDIIDFDYPQWHTAGDLPEECAPASLEQVGRVLTAWLAKPKPNPQRRTR